MLEDGRFSGIVVDTDSPFIFSGSDSRGCAEGGASMVDAVVPGASYLDSVCCTFSCAAAGSVPVDEVTCCDPSLEVVGWTSPCPVGAGEVDGSVADISYLHAISKANRWIGCGSSDGGLEHHEENHPKAVVSSLAAVAN